MGNKISTLDKIIGEFDDAEHSLNDARARLEENLWEMVAEAELSEQARCIGWIKHCKTTEEAIDKIEGGFLFPSGEKEG